MRILTAALAAAVALGTAAEARADVIYTFTQTSAQKSDGSPSSAVFSGSITVTDAAYASGFAFNREYRAGTIISEGVAGLVDVLITIPGSGGRTIIDRQSLDALPPPFRSDATFTNTVFKFSAGPMGALAGSFLYTNTSTVFSLNITAAGVASGTYGADNLDLLCGTGATCTYTASVTQTQVATQTPVTPTPVPEPASLALFGAGLLGLAAVRRKRAG